MRISSQKIIFFEQRLKDFFQKTGRVELPWRKKNITAYEVWVSEIMLQQTQVVRVIEYYRRFIERFPIVETLAKASWEEFLPYYQGLGYYARGRNMLKVAREVVDTYGGTFPRTRSLLEALPGIGPYTASAILSFAYGENHLAWDTNLKRVIGRFFFGGKQLVSDEEFWEGRFTMNKKDMNAALMDFGSALCTARPKCQACSLRTRCVYFKEGGEQEQSAISKKQSTKQKGRQGNEKETRTVVFLHENHKHYFSSVVKRYRPFILPTGYVTRADIKAYFFEKYALTLAVRPPHDKRVTNGKATILVNAQILLGEPKFTLFTKNEVKEYTTGTFE